MTDPVCTAANALIILCATQIQSLSMKYIAENMFDVGQAFIAMSRVSVILCRGCASLNCPFDFSNLSNTYNRAFLQRQQLCR